MIKRKSDLNLYLPLVVLFLLLVFSYSCGNSKQQSVPNDASLTPVERQIKNTEWNVTEVSEDIRWKYFHFDTLFSAKQYITLLDVNLNGDILVDIPYVSEGFIKTSDAGASSDATATINGSFFDTSKGGSVVFLRKDGKIINYTRDGFNPYRENAGFVIDKSGKVSIIERPSDDANGWESVDAQHLLVSGPLLIDEGEPVHQSDDPFNANRHPRTAAGITKDNHLICLVVDGRSPNSYGMSIAELTEIMLALGCIQAMNLDGGGSSTAWVKEYGVVNHPSDNKQFDHEGERGVANAIVIQQE